ncbi:hypothetical protein Scep_012583 [Stephania cephalantha]|uniref:F-box domain-containing protein n=1 Tax=Stephania cephalantha TaxID=152367 RepID=A0AAP0JG81_9MAGN
MAAKLPQDMIFNIFSWLPVRALYRFRCVCKSWQSLVSDPCFIKTYNDQSNDSQSLSLIVNNYGPYLHRLDVINPFVASNKDITSISLDIQSSFNGVSASQRHLIGSCYGLICFHDHALDVCCVLNPFTGDSEKLPTVEELADLGHFYSCVWGFGSSSKAEDFKVLKIVYFRSDWHSSDKQAAAFIHTVNSNSSSWRRIVEPIDYYIYPDTQIVVDGNPHWRGTYLNGQDISLKIVVFNVAEERFLELPYPDHFEDEKYTVEFMGVLRGSICIFRCFYSGVVEVWVMEEYGVKESWKRIFSFAEPKLGNLTRIRQKNLWFLPNSDILLVAYDKQIVLYDPSNGCFQEIAVPNTRSESRIEVVDCTEKLVLLKGRNASKVRIGSV